MNAFTLPNDSGADVQSAVHTDFLLLHFPFLSAAGSSNTLPEQPLPEREPLGLTQFCKLTSTQGIMKLGSLGAANKSPQILVSVK